MTDRVPVGNGAAPHDESREDVGSAVVSEQEVVVRKVRGELTGRFDVLYPGDFSGAEERELLQSRSWN